MVELTAMTPLDGMAPLAIGGMTLCEVDLGRLTSVAPYKGKAAALGKALKAAHGMGWPEPNRATGKEGARAIWFGQGMALLAGPEAAAGLSDHAALSDQSDAWAAVALEGAGAVDVLARVTPLDLRAKQFQPGHTARTELQHMMASVTKTGEDAFLILVFRSVAATLLHDMQTAMEGVAARGRP
ncbi:MAG: hypothetical protein RIC49_12300 [Phycisphaerales bacterium]